MDVVVHRAQMVWIALYDRFKCADDLLSPILRAAVEVPQTPGMQFHRAFSKERGGIEIVRIFFSDLAHRVAILLSCLLQVGFRIGREALGHRVDVILLTFGSTGREIDCLLNGIMRLPEALFTCRIVVIWSDGLRDS